MYIWFAYHSLTHPVSPCLCPGSAFLLLCAVSRSLSDIVSPHSLSFSVSPRRRGRRTPSRPSTTCGPPSSPRGGPPPASRGPLPAAGHRGRGPSSTRHRRRGPLWMHKRRMGSLSARGPLPVIQRRRGPFLAIHRRRGPRGRGSGPPPPTIRRSTRPRGTSRCVSVRDASGEGRRKAQKGRAARPVLNVNL
jgi:hypothetical protein